MIYYVHYACMHIALPTLQQYLTTQVYSHSKSETTKNMQRYAEVYKGIQRCTEVYRDIQRLVMMVHCKYPAHCLIQQLHFIMPE